MCASIIITLDYHPVLAIPSFEGPSCMGILALKCHAIETHYNNFPLGIEGFYIIFLWGFFNQIIQTVRVLIFNFLLIYFYHWNEWPKLPIDPSWMTQVIQKFKMTMTQVDNKYTLGILHISHTYAIQTLFI